MKKSKELTLQSTACHELSHALACIHLRLPFIDVRIGRIRHKKLNGKEAAGYIRRPRYAHVKDKTNFWRREIVMALAGGAGTRALLFGPSGVEHDEKQVREIVTQHLGVPKDRIDSFLVPFRERAATLFRLPHIENTVEELISALVEKRKLTAHEIRASYQKHKAFEMRIRRFLKSAATKAA
jgi:hypothetical protein